MTELIASQANMETPEQKAFLDEIARLTRENKQLKLWRTFENKDWKDPDLDYVLGMCGAMEATLVDALESFSEEDLAMCPVYIREVIPNLLIQAKRNTAWFDKASKRMMSCGRGCRPTLIAQEKKEKLADC